MKTHVALLALAGACSLPAQAALVTGADWGVHGSVEQVTDRLAGRSSQDSIFFTLADARDLSSAAVSNHDDRSQHSRQGTVTLFRAADLSDDTRLGSYVFGSAPDSAPHAFGTLAAGRYYYSISSIGNGLLGGTYTVSSMLQGAPGMVEPAFAVPEPQGGLLVLTALGALAWLRRRSRIGR